MMHTRWTDAHMGRESEVDDWYGDALSVPCGFLLIDLSPRTDDQLRYCTNTGSIPLYFNFPECLNNLMILDDEHSKFLSTQNSPIAFPQVQKSFPHCCSKQFI